MRERRRVLVWDCRGRGQHRSRACVGLVELFEAGRYTVDRRLVEDKLHGGCCLPISFFCVSRSVHVSRRPAGDGTATSRLMFFSLCTLASCTAYS
jgi:hypothetical protein